VTKYLRWTIFKRRSLFWLMVLEASVHGHFSPLFLA
jgi:hypothetical protein